jgi:heme-degrading monooxygenase HmoA
MIKHLVLAKFKRSVTNGQIAELVKSLAALPSMIPEIRGYDFGRDIRPERSFDFALVSEFSDVEALETYKTQKDHAETARYIRSLSEDIQIVDFEF